MTKGKRIILIVGLPGSGKTYAVDFVKKKLGAKTIHSGDIIREEIERQGLKYSPTADAAVAHWFHQYGREAVLVQKVFEKIVRSRKKLIIVEGFRDIDQLQVLEDLLDHKVSVITIKCNFKTRLKRELERGRFGKDETKEYIKNRDISEKHRGLERLIRQAKYKIDNNGTKKQLEVKIIKMVKKLNK
ncbi:MAG: nucleoside monophosphate kinase [Nanoarchaeota archaeon]|nr:nucleoside monophosphate kinase [Nanoarchaeota archaeon]